MKLTIDLLSFRQAVNNAAVATRPNSPKPTLVNLRLTADNGVLRVDGTNLEQYVWATATANVERAGECLVRAEKLKAILASCTADDVSLVVDGDKATIRSGRARWTLQTESTELWPSLPSAKGVETQVPVERWRFCVGAAASVVDSGDSSHYALDSVLHSLDNGRLDIVGTDGRAMLATGLEAEGAAASSLFPSSAVPMALKCLPDTGGVALALDDASMCFTYAGGGFHTRTVEGRFPKWRDVMPKDDVDWLALDNELWLNALRQVAITTSQESAGIDLRVSEGVALLSSQSAEVGKSEVELPTAYSGEAIKVCFNGSRLLSTLRVLSGQQVELAVFGKGTGVRLRTDAVEYVLMGMSKE